MIETRGDWWVATRRGIARFAPTQRPHELNRRRPETWHRNPLRVTGAVVLSVLEDSRGDIWTAGVIEGGRSGLSRWERRTGVFHQCSTDEHLRDLNTHFAYTLAEIGRATSGLGSAVPAASRATGTARSTGSTSGTCFPSRVRDILSDSAGRLWIASYRGLVRVDDPRAPSPVFRRCTTRDGRSSNETTALVEDPRGLVYVATPPPGCRCRWRAIIESAKGRHAGSDRVRRAACGMTSHQISIASLQQHVGQELGVSDWLEVTQQLIDQFAAASGDRQWIHVDPQRAAEASPFGTTIAHGFLVLSLISTFATQAVRMAGVTMAVNYGLNRVRFTAPVAAGAHIRGRFVLAAVEQREDAVQVVWHVTVERRQHEKPCCVADWIVRYYGSG